MWRHAAVVLCLIVLMSLLGRQLYGLVPRPVVWAIIGAGGVAALMASAFLYQGPARRSTLTLAVAGGLAVLGLAVYFGLLTSAEIAHVLLFGGLGATLRHLPPLPAIPVLLSASAGDEALQALLPYRVGSLTDVALNVALACGSYLLLRYHAGFGAAHEREV